MDGQQLNNLFLAIRDCEALVIPSERDGGEVGCILLKLPGVTDRCELLDHVVSLRGALEVAATSCLTEVDATVDEIRSAIRFKKAVSELLED